jgi:hypothetical protein
MHIIIYCHTLIYIVVHYLTLVIGTRVAICRVHANPPWHRCCNKQLTKRTQFLKIISVYTPLNPLFHSRYINPNHCNTLNPTNQFMAHPINHMAELNTKTKTIEAKGGRGLEFRDFKLSLSIVYFSFYKFYSR